MWLKDLLLSVLSVFAISLPPVSCTGWKPIAPPAEYYATKPTTCTSDCDLKYNHPFLSDSVGAQAETQLKNVLVKQTTTFTQDKDYLSSNKKLDLDVLRPTEISFFPQDEDKTVEAAVGKSPTSYYSFKLYGAPQKPAKTIYYGNLDLAKPKVINSVKLYKPYKQNDAKTLKPASFVENEVGLYRPLKSNLYDEHCSLYKVSFRQHLYYQYVQYKVHMPELKEFTLCLWSQFHNHSHDHSLFSYAVKNHRKAIYLWVSNLNDPGYLNLKIMGKAIFRLNYPIKLYKWYHNCLSWNGHTGEWQVWVDSHRIARGFHNLLVGHKIPGGGVAISGQDHRHYGKGFQEIPEFLKGTGGLEGEITMLQLYKVALTAGKAYNDHSHHHSHYTSTTTEPPEIPTEEPSTTTDHPFLENGQLKPHINVLELAEALKNKNFHLPEHEPSYDYYQKPLSHPYVNHISPLAVHGNTINFLGLPNHAIFKRNDESEAINSSNETIKNKNVDEQNENYEKVKIINNVSDKVRVEKIKFESEKHQLTNDSITSLMDVDTSNEESAESFTQIYDEDLSEETTHDSGFRVGRKRLRRNNPSSSYRIIPSQRVLIRGVKPLRYLSYGSKKRNEVRRTVLNNNEKEPSKRFIIYEDPYASFGAVGLINQEAASYGGVYPSEYSYDHFSQISGDFSDIHENDDHEESDSDHNDYPEKSIKKEVELAEGEVRRVMEVCSGCHLDPFRKVAVISWRSTPKKIYSGALFLKAKSECHNF